MSQNITEREIDEIVISDANDDSAWEESIAVKRKKVFPIIFSLSHEIVCEKDILSGTPVFRGTRVPVSALLDNLAAGLTIDNFLENFPSVSRQQALDVLSSFKKTVSSA